MIHRPTLLVMRQPRRRRPMGCIHYAVLALLVMLSGAGFAALILHLTGRLP